MPNITITPIEVEAEVKQYTLVGDDIYVKRYDNNNIPDWYKNMIDNILNSNTTVINLTDSYNYLNGLQQGYNLSITQLQDGQLVIDTRLESLKSSNDVALAGIADLWITKIDGASAQAIADTTVGAFFTGGNATSGAWFNERISTYASAVQSNASNITVLAATLNNQTVRIDTIDEVLVTLDGWSANASKLITAPDGAITGWSFGDGSNMQSFFKIYAESFSISDGATGYTPFSIVGNNIQFNGIVSFTNVTGAPAIPDSVSDLVNDSGYTTLSAVAAQGYVLPAGVANAINTNTTTINGSKITTGSIYAAALDVNALSGVKGLFTRATNPAAGGYGEALAAIQQSGVWCFSGRNDTSSGAAVGVAGVSTASSTGIGVWGHSKAYGVFGVTTSGTGQWGLYTDQKAYAGGGYSPFTGSHIVYSKDILEVGDICSVVDSWAINVNQTCVWVDKTMVANDKKVIGVVSYPNSPLLTNIEHNPLFADKLEDDIYSYKPEYLDFITGMIEDNFTEVCINSLGEGAINVNSENGNIEIGDYICSSNIPGKGMKQNDDILHNYTVAKALESVDWTTEQSTTKMIACTYHCG